MFILLYHIVHHETTWSAMNLLVPTTPRLNDVFQAPPRSRETRRPRQWVCPRHHHKDLHAVALWQNVQFEPVELIVAKKKTFPKSREFAITFKRKALTTPKNRRIFVRSKFVVVFSAPQKLRPLTKNRRVTRRRCLPPWRGRRPCHSA